MLVIYIKEEHCFEKNSIISADAGIVDYIVAAVRFVASGHSRSRQLQLPDREGSINASESNNRSESHLNGFNYGGRPIIGIVQRYTNHQ